MAITKTLVTMVLGAALSVTAMAQTKSVSGVVRDLESRVVLDNAKVVFHNVNSKHDVDSVFTDVFGKYNASFPLTAIKTSPTLPDHLAVFPNFPNPFNPSTRIRFETPHVGDVEVGVYDIQGKPFIEKKFELGAGSHELEVSGLGSTGIKIYRIKTNDGMVTGKMVQLDASVLAPSVELVGSGGFVPALNKVSVDQYSATASRNHYKSLTLAVPDGVSISNLDFDLEYVKDSFDHDFVMKFFDLDGYPVSGFNARIDGSGKSYSVPVVDGIASFSTRNMTDSLATFSHDGSDFLKWTIVTDNSSSNWGKANVAQNPDKSTWATVNLKTLDYLDTVQVYLVNKTAKSTVFGDLPMDGIEALSMIETRAPGTTVKWRPFSANDSVDNVLFTWDWQSSLRQDSTVIARNIDAINLVTGAMALPGNGKELVKFKTVVLVDSLSDPYWTIIKNRNLENVTWVQYDLGAPGNVTNKRSDRTMKYAYSLLENTGDLTMVSEEYAKFVNAEDPPGKGVGGLVYDTANNKINQFGRYCMHFKFLLNPGTITR